jgi:putative ABC transport system permease protein
LRVGDEQLELRSNSTSSIESIIVAESDAALLDVSLAIDEFWLRLDDEADPNAVIDDLYDLADSHGLSIAVGGMSGYRETLTTALDALVFVITALLGVAVLIAIIGVGNTLSLSVIERTRESALLRALGFTRKQLRQSLAVEAVLLALLGSLIGIVLGVAFGWIGAITVVGDAWPIALALPVARIGLIVVIAVICGLLASVLPARRATRADPVVALADV